MRSIRLGEGDRELARTLFSMMADVFEEESEVLSDDYLDKLLAREHFWATVVTKPVQRQLISTKWRGSPNGRRRCSVSTTFATIAGVSARFDSPPIQKAGIT